MSENSNKEHLGVGIILGLFLGVASTLLLYHPAATKFSELSPGFHLTNGAQLIVVPNVTLHTKPNAYSFMFKDRVTVTMLGSVLLYEDFTVSSADSLKAFLISRGVPFEVLYGEVPSWLK